MRASRSKKRAVDARRTQKRGGAGRARKAGAGPLKRPAKAGGNLSRASGQGASASGQDSKAVKDLLATPPSRKKVAGKRPHAAGVPGEGPVVRSALGSEVGIASPVGLGAAEGRGAAAWEPSVPVPATERGTPPPLPAPIASFVF
jgi:hypothetical protein